MDKTQHKNGLWRIRPGFGFDIRQSMTSISQADETIGDLVLSPLLVSVLSDLLQDREENSCSEQKIRENLLSIGHSGAAVDQLLDSLICAGVAVRSNVGSSQRLVERLSQWTSNIDDALTSIRTSHVAFLAESDCSSDLIHALAEWGVDVNHTDDALDLLEVSTHHPVAGIDLLVAWGVEDSATQECIRSCMSRCIPIVPIREEGPYICVGPVHVRGVSACPFCTHNLSPEFQALDVGRPNSNALTGWDTVTGMLAEFLAGRTGIESPLLCHILDKDGRYISCQAAPIAPRCPACSRLNRFPENAIIHG